MHKRYNQFRFNLNYLFDGESKKKSSITEKWIDEKKREKRSKENRRHKTVHFALWMLQSFHIIILELVALPFAWLK